MSRRIAIRCPICGKISFHKISVELFERRKSIDKGIVPVLIKHVVCSHLFIGYVDTQFMIRHYIPVKNEEEIPFVFVIEENPLIGKNIIRAQESVITA